MKEWVGKTPDSMPPPTVRLRIFEREGGRCHLTGVLIKTGDLWDLDHKKRIEDGGENRETNLFPALREPHRKKTAEETTRGKKADRSRMAHLGIKDEPARPLEGRGFPKAKKDKSAADVFALLPRKRLYTDG